MSNTRSHDDNYKTLMTKLTGLGLIMGAKRDFGKYVHKSKIDHPYSLLIVSDAEYKYTLYELLHSGPENKKKILGVGRKNVVRAAVNVETGEEVAVKVYPLYEKASAPSAFQLESFRSGSITNKWQMVQAINKALPGIVLTFKDFIVAGDKSKAEHPNRIVLYAVTNKLGQSFFDFIRDENNSIEIIKQIFVKLFKNVRKLYQLEVTWVDGNLHHVLLDSDLNPVICNPESSLLQHALSDYRVGLFIGLSLELQSFIHDRFDYNPDGHYLRVFNVELDAFIKANDSFQIPDIEASVNDFFDTVIHLSNRKKTLYKFFCCRGLCAFTPTASVTAPRPT